MKDGPGPIGIFFIILSMLAFSAAIDFMFDYISSTKAAADKVNSACAAAGMEVANE